jgi:hypothetical protein
VGRRVALVDGIEEALHRIADMLFIINETLKKMNKNLEEINKKTLDWRINNGTDEVTED